MPVPQTFDVTRSVPSMSVRSFQFSAIAPHPFQVEIPHKADPPPLHTNDDDTDMTPQGSQPRAAENVKVLTNSAVEQSVLELQHEGVVVVRVYHRVAALCAGKKRVVSSHQPQNKIYPSFTQAASCSARRNVTSA